mmetsp:Transcript_14101/g.18390  ORF Transcript_14101/g.18390 Transcript_14101/m.18390 type:complete len:97 (-) Transcript_14101:603-893(-)
MEETNNQPLVSWTAVVGEGQQRPRPLYNNRRHILLLGEADFSFARALAQECINNNNSSNDEEDPIHAMNLCTVKSRPPNTELGMRLQIDTTMVMNN